MSALPLSLSSLTEGIDHSPIGPMRHDPAATTGRLNPRDERECEWGIRVMGSDPAIFHRTSMDRAIYRQRRAIRRGDHPYRARGRRIQRAA